MFTINSIGVDLNDYTDKMYLKDSMTVSIPISFEDLNPHIQDAIKESIVNDNTPDYTITDTTLDIRFSDYNDVSIYICTNFDIGSSGSETHTVIPLSVDEFAGIKGFGIASKCKLMRQAARNRRSNI